MRKILIVSMLLTIASLLGQAQDGNEFDFWIGKWDLSWEYGDGTQGIGTNNILKTLDGKVIQENFEAIDTGPYNGFKGTSVSVFNPNSKTWHQAWADNQGGFFNFIGEVEEDRRIFKTLPYHKDGKEIILRMVFYDIKENSMTWDWEQSQDGGKTWALQWRIKYKKAI
jgi:hypothetical protein